MTPEHILNFLQVPNSKLLKLLKKTCRSRTFIYILFLGCVSYGLITHYLGWKEAFPRSGVLLICLAITFVYLNHFVSSSLNILNTQNIKLDSMKGDLKEVNSAHSDSQFLTAARKEIQSSLKTELDSTEFVQSKLVTAEFILGVSGTLVWGFGSSLPSFT